jgi:glycosyltransferase involved in cell wall biosynthesis
VSARAETSAPADQPARGGGGRRDGRIHVLTLVDHLGTTGGAEHLAFDIATRIDPARFRSSFCASRYPGWGGAASADERDASARLRDAEVAFIPLERHGRADVFAWRKLARYMRREHVDVVHAHMFGSNLWGTVLGRLCGVPVIIAHEHTWSFEGQPLRKLLDREVIGRFCSVFIAVSREDRCRIIEIERVPAGRVRFLANGITARAPTPGRDLRPELSPAGGPLVGSIGGLRRQKGYDVFIRASALLRERHPDLRVVIAGEGARRPELEALIEGLALADTVTLLGRRLDVPDILAALDVAVSSSNYEGSPLAVMEYMEAGLPIVASRVGGVPDLIDDGVQGLLVEAGDVEQLAGAIERMLSDRERALQMGARARERRRAEFDLDVMVSNVEALYEEQVAAKRDSSRRARAEA